MTSTSLAFSDATDIARRIREGELSALECLEYFLARVERFDPDLNATVVLDATRARARAREADVLQSLGENWGPLHGVPMMIKESYDIDGLPTTFGFPAFADNIASADSTVVSRLKAAGAVFFGKTNVPVALSDFQSYNEIHGTTNNPWNLTRGPGGSSGGESAALAAGLTSLGCGSDIGGSIRNPAHYCGVYGHKSTYGIVPHHGHSVIPTAHAIDLAVYGPMARSARDLKLALELIAGPGPLPEPGWQLALPYPKKRLGELKVAVWSSESISPVEPEISQRCIDVAEALAKAGAHVSDTARPDIDVEEAHSCYMKLLASALLLRQPSDAFAAARQRVTALQPDDTSPEARRAWDEVMPHRTWLNLQETRTKLRFRWQAFFADWDILVCPISCTSAFEHDHRPFGERTLEVNGEAVPYFQQLFWAGLISASYLPSTVIPTGPDKSGLPIGVQLVSAEYNDMLTIDVATKLTNLGFDFQAPPGYDD